MQSIFQRFLSFDRLIGPTLVRFVYYFGAAVIVVFALGVLLMAVFSLAGGNIGPAAMQLLAVPAVATVALVYWRFMCELFMLAFLAFERLGEVRDLMRIAAGVDAAPDPNHPEF